LAVLQTPLSLFADVSAHVCVVCCRGAGPIGLAAAYLALKLKKARRVVSIDKVRRRMDAGRTKPGSGLATARQNFAHAHTYTTSA